MHKLRLVNEVTQNFICILIIFNNNANRMDVHVHQNKYFWVQQPAYFGPELIHSNYFHENKQNQANYSMSISQLLYMYTCSKIICVV